MSKKKSPKKQLTFGFEGSGQDSDPKTVSKSESQHSQGKVVYFDGRKDIYKKILNRQMK